MKHRIILLLFVFAIYSFVTVTQAQPGGATSAREASPIDFTGYWVALVTEDWRFRMVTAPAGDYEGIGLTPRAREIADAWDPEADVASG